MLICFENLTMDKVLSFFTILVCYLHLTNSWCPPPNNALEDLVHFADVVVVGKVSEIIPDPSPSTYEEPSYGARIDVRCSYKGGLFPRRIPGTITIGEAGNFTEACLWHALELNKEYILFLQHTSRIFPGHHEFYVQTDMAQPVTKVGELTNVCYLELVYPGLNPSRKECPRPTESYDDCVKRPDYTNIIF